MQNKASVHFLTLSPLRDFLQKMFLYCISERVENQTLSRRGKSVRRWSHYSSQSVKMRRFIGDVYFVQLSYKLWLRSRPFSFAEAFFLGGVLEGFVRIGI